MPDDAYFVEWRMAGVVPEEQAADDRAASRAPARVVRLRGVRSAHQEPGASAVHPSSLSRLRRRSPGRAAAEQFLSEFDAMFEAFTQAAA